MFLLSNPIFKEEEKVADNERIPEEVRFLSAGFWTVPGVRDDSTGSDSGTIYYLKNGEKFKMTLTITTVAKEVWGECKRSLNTKNILTADLHNIVFFVILVTEEEAANDSSLVDASQLRSIPVVRF